MCSPFVRDMEAFIDKISYWHSYLVVNFVLE